MRRSISLARSWVGSSWWLPVKQEPPPRHSISMCLIRDDGSLVTDIAAASLEHARLLAEEPETYYVTDHYRSDSVILVRLSQINRKSLQALIQQA